MHSVPCSRKKFLSSHLHNSASDFIFFSGRVVLILNNFLACCEKETSCFHQLHLSFKIMYSDKLPYTFSNASVQ